MARARKASPVSPSARATSSFTVVSGPPSSYMPGRYTAPSTSTRLAKRSSTAPTDTESPSARRHDVYDGSCTLYRLFSRPLRRTTVTSFI